MRRWSGRRGRPAAAEGARSAGGRGLSSVHAGACGTGSAQARAVAQSVGLNEIQGTDHHEHPAAQALPSARNKGRARVTRLELDRQLAGSAPGLAVLRP